MISPIRKGCGPRALGKYSTQTPTPFKAKNEEGKEQGADGRACWKGYRFAGTVNGKDRCVETGSPFKISEQQYNKENREMRKENPTMGKKLTSGKNKRRVSFACRFGSMDGSMTDDNGTPSSLSKALKKWGFASKEAARSFCNNNKES